MKKKSMRTFVRENRALIDSVAARVCGQHIKMNDDEREDWVLNDEGLYLKAQNEGVDV